MNYNEIRLKVSAMLEPLGFECYPFKVGWYNEKVAHDFRLDCDFDTVAFVVVSTPAMFEKAFKPFVCRQDCSEDCGRDLIDECIAQQFQNVQQLIPDHDIQCIHDFEMDHFRRPRILVQTAGHVAGAAHYYQRKDVVSAPWPADKKICGVSVHPRYGGWFALRGVIIIRTCQAPDLEPCHPPDVVCGDELRIKLLEQFNFNWQDWNWRDIIPTEAVYSDEQKEYFGTPPRQRGPLIQKIQSTVSIPGIQGV